MQPKSEITAATAKSVASGLGYPNARVETSAAPTGWISNSGNPIEKVSRETI
ncbi:MAG: hypothetical protein RL196_776 [Actinomycetota bacterium]|jgi:hypothetical protein